MVALEPEQADALLICCILFLSEMSYEFFKLFVTELKFLDRK